MMNARLHVIARHAEAAQRLLGELEQHAEAARTALSRDSGADFFAAVDARDELLEELDVVVSQMTSERAEQAAAGLEQDAATNRLISEMARAAARALESHEQLANDARRERDRLSGVLSRTDSPDAVATQYAVATGAARPRAFSVTG